MHFVYDKVYKILLQFRNINTLLYCEILSIYVYLWYQICKLLFAFRKQFSISEEYILFTDIKKSENIMCNIEAILHQIRCFKFIAATKFCASFIVIIHFIRPDMPCDDFSLHYYLNRWNQKTSYQQIWHPHEVKQRSLEMCNFMVI